LGNNLGLQLGRLFARRKTHIAAIAGSYFRGKLDTVFRTASRGWVHGKALSQRPASRVSSIAMAARCGSRRRDAKAVTLPNSNFVAIQVASSKEAGRHIATTRR